MTEHQLGSMQGKVHTGFYNMYVSSIESVRPTIEALRNTGFGDVLYIAGHSLGCALAEFAAYDLSSPPFSSFPFTSYHLVGTGCPRVGDVTFAKVGIFCCALVYTRTTS